MKDQITDLRYENVIQLESTVSSKKFMANVFLWMFVALAISAGLAFWFSSNPVLQAQLIDFNTGRTTLLGKVAMFSPLAFVLLMSFGFNRLSYPALVGVFVSYAALTGISLSFILLVYAATSVVACFLTASLLFGVMAVAGYVTHQDLTRFGSILMMLLIGLVIASLVNFFLNSDQLGYIISFVGVAVFVGLTAYDVQKLKRIGEQVEYGATAGKKLSIMGALTLYLDFINLFLFLLRFFGGDRRK